MRRNTMQMRSWLALISCGVILSLPAQADQHWGNQASHQTATLAAPEYLAGYELTGQSQPDLTTRSLNYRDHYNQQTVHVMFQAKQPSLDAHAKFVKQQLTAKVPNIAFAGEFKGTIRKSGQAYTFHYLAYRYKQDDIATNPTLLGHTVVLNSDARTIVTSQVGPELLGRKSKSTTARFSANRLFSFIKALDWQDDRW